MLADRVRNVSGKVKEIPMLYTRRNSNTTEYSRDCINWLSRSFSSWIYPNDDTISSNSKLEVFIASTDNETNSIRFSPNILEYGFITHARFAHSTDTWVIASSYAGDGRWITINGSSNGSIWTTYKNDLSIFNSQGGWNFSNGSQFRTMFYAPAPANGVFVSVNNAVRFLPANSSTADSQAISEPAMVYIPLLDRVLYGNSKNLSYTNHFATGNRERISMSLSDVNVNFPNNIIHDGFGVVVSWLSNRNWSISFDGGLTWENRSATDVPAQTTGSWLLRQILPTGRNGEIIFSQSLSGDVDYYLHNYKSNTWAYLGRDRNLFRIKSWEVKN